MLTDQLKIEDDTKTFEPLQNVVNNFRKVCKSLELHFILSYLVDYVHAISSLVTSLESYLIIINSLPGSSIILTALFKWPSKHDK